MRDVQTGPCVLPRPLRPRGAPRACVQPGDIRVRSAAEAQPTAPDALFPRSRILPAFRGFVVASFARPPELAPRLLATGPSSASSAACASTAGASAPRPTRRAEATFFPDQTLRSGARLPHAQLSHCITLKVPRRLSFFPCRLPCT